MEDINQLRQQRIELQEELELWEFRLQQTVRAISDHEHARIAEKVPRPLRQRLAQEQTLVSMTKDSLRVVKAKIMACTVERLGVK